MADVPGEYIGPIESGHFVSSLEGALGAAAHAKAPRLIRGRVVAVRKSAGHQEPGHLLDVTVGAALATEIVVQTEDGNCVGLEGRQVIVSVMEMP